MKQLYAVVAVVEVAKVMSKIFPDDKNCICISYL